MIIEDVALDLTEVRVLGDTLQQIGQYLYRR